ncbi:MAG TPA: DUF402 domain-containing protein, partial [Gaiellaceae bacterium]|nr:DUF402 domain-containing protein [Gaiellaceae bacterium]
ALVGGRLGALAASRHLADRVTVALREVWRGRVWLARAWTLLDERPDRIVLAAGPGAETRLPVDRAGRRLRVPTDDWTLAPGQWENWTVRVTCPGEPWSTLVFFDANGRHASWYVNFEQPLARTAVGWDTLDWKLDLLAFPDGRRELKDEEELLLAAAAGVVDERTVRAALDRVLASPPWPTGLEDVELDEAWCAARLPEGALDL